MIKSIKFVNKYKTCVFYKYEVYSYDTNIHILAQELTKEGVIDDFLDINLVLREKETDPKLREMLSKNFSDIFLIFDFDPQHNYPSFNKVQTLLDYFTDSGFLYAI